MIEEVEVPEVEVEPGDAGKSETISPEPGPALEEAEVETTPVVPSRSSRASRSSAPVVEESGVTVSLSSLMFRKSRRNSASVAAVQDRLVALGYGAARSDLRGWFHEGTRQAVAEFQKNEGLGTVAGEVDSDTLDALLSGTGAVAVA